MHLPDHPGVLFTPPYHAPMEDFWATFAGHDRPLVIVWAQRHGWERIAAWGCQGHDPGSWLDIVLFHRDTEARFELAEWDSTTPGIAVASYAYPTAELRNAATDVLAFSHWKRARKPWVEDIASFPDIPAHLRGPFSWQRLAQAIGEDPGPQ